MSSVPSELRYLKSHEWVRREADGSVTVGITDHAQQQLGDLVFVDLPDVDRVVSAGEACTVVESVKAASDVYSPLSGKVLALNALLRDQPELINAAPYDAGWLFKLQPSDAAEFDALLSADAYSAQIAAEDH